jgi:hypothetical protein
MLRWLKKSTARDDGIDGREDLPPARLTVHSEPFVKILAFRKLYREAQVAGALEESQSSGKGSIVARTGTHQCRFRVFPELVLLGTLRYISAWLEGACLSSIEDYDGIGRIHQIKLLQAEECRHS